MMLPLITGPWPHIVLHVPLHHFVVPLQSLWSMLKEPKYQARAAVSAQFFNFGVYISTWVSAIPAMKSAFNLSDSQLGFFILSFGISSLCMLFPIGKIIHKWGPHPVALWSGTSGPLALSFLPYLALKEIQPFYFIFLIGAIGSGSGIAFNTKATQIETVWRKPIMSSFHGCWSIGALTGSCLYAFLLHKGFTWNILLPCTLYYSATVNLLSNYFMRKWPSPELLRAAEGVSASTPTNAVLRACVLPEVEPLGSQIDSLTQPLMSEGLIQSGMNMLAGSESNRCIPVEDPQEAVPAPQRRCVAVVPPVANVGSPIMIIRSADARLDLKPARLMHPDVLLIGTMMAFALMAEGSIGDWTALYFLRYRHVPPSKGPLGYSACAFAMASCRLFAEPVIMRFGRHVVLRIGALIAAIGFLGFLFIPFYTVNLLCCALIGVGLSNNMPILTSMMGRLDHTPTALALSYGSAMAQFGLLAGPAFIGHLAGFTHSLKLALLVPVGCLFFNFLASIYLHYRRIGEVI